MTTQLGKQVLVSRTVYLYSELTKEAQAKAVELTRESIYEVLPNSEVTECLKETASNHLTGKCDYETVGKLFGHKQLEMEWNLSHCQGDGVALYGTIYRDNASQLTFADNVNHVLLVRNSYGTFYSHYNTFCIEYYTEDYECVGRTGYANGVALFMNSEGKPTLFGTSDKHDMNKLQHKAWIAMQETESELRQLCKDLAKTGYETIEDMTSEATAVEMLTDIQWQERRFNADGTLAPMDWWTNE